MVVSVVSVVLIGVTAYVNSLAPGPGVGRRIAADSGHWNGRTCCHLGEHPLHGTQSWDGGNTVGEAERFARLMRELKERAGLSYGTLARRLHTSTSTLHRYCNGEAV